MDPVTYFASRVGGLESWNPTSTGIKQLQGAWLSARSHSDGSIGT